MVSIVERLDYERFVYPSVGYTVMNKCMHALIKMLPTPAIKQHVQISLTNYKITQAIRNRFLHEHFVNIIKESCSQVLMFKLNINVFLWFFFTFYYDRL